MKQSESLKMANRLSLSTAEGGEIYVESKIPDSLSMLDVLHANQFEGEIFDPKLSEQVEEDFYRGAPPNWLNFYISEQAELGGTGSAFIKRDEYETLKERIHHRRRKGPGTSTVKLFHQQGCGGTTLAMQVLWDLRRTFRCAVLTGSSSDVTKVAQDVVNLFTAGSQGHQNTVLLLLNDEFILDTLQDSIMEEIAEQNLEIDMPVVILLNCVRTSDDVIHQKEHAYKEKQSLQKNERKCIILKKTLSGNEKAFLDKKKEELSKRFGDRCEQFHGFNILQSNFSQEYNREACAALKDIKRAKKPLKMQLVAILSLLNAYVPGSYLLESQCLDFLRHEGLPLEDQIQPFSHLIITFQQDVRSEKKVCMAHTMIAQCCTELLADAGVTRSDTAKNFLNNFCRDSVPPCLLGFVKHMLTKREIKREEDPINGTDIKEKKEKFSRLILDITKMERNGNDKKEGKIQSVSVLKVASKTFNQNPFFPQALARFYYIELEDYNKAEILAKEAKQRDPRNSYVADTLGQVYKNHLKNKKVSDKPREILQLAQKATEAFEEEEKLAENEHMKDKKGDGKTKMLRALNTRGQFGYLEVCSLLYDQLVSHNEIWKKVLTKNVSLGSVLKSLGDQKLFKFNELINNLREMVEKKFEFFDIFLTYSESVVKKDDPSYISRKVAECYKKYVGDAEPNDQLQKTLHKLKQKLAVTSAGVLSGLERCTRSNMKDIAIWWKEICQHKDSPRNALASYILANIMLINMKETPSSSDYQSAFQKKMSLDPEMQPEFHMLALLVCWPTDDEDKLVSDLHRLIKNIQDSYEQEYKTLFESRYLRPLFFIGPGRDLSRFVHRRNLEILWTKDALKAPNTNWWNENIFKDPTVQDSLLRVEGVVRNYRLYATFGGTEVEVNVNRRDSLWKSGQVSFYLGFTISGPVGFSIHRRTGGQPERLLETSGNEMNSSEWTELKPEVNIMDGIHTYSLQSESGNYECSESALRWVCKERVSFRYQFSSWDGFTRKPVCMDYMPAGPLMNIEVTAGKMEEVHLPHWICMDANAVSDMFRVLHVDSYGDYMEQVSEVTSSHVKLIRPDLSPRGAMIRKKLGFPVKISADVLIYIRIITDLTLHVYLVPRDPGLQQGVDKVEKSDGFKIIRKPSPTDPLQLEGHYYLSTDSDTAKVSPNKRKLTWEWSNNNFFEVVIGNVNSENFENLELKLKGEQKKNKGKDTVWTCTIGTDDYKKKSIHHEDSQHFVECHRAALINRVSETGAILDKLREKDLISDENYDNVRGFKTTRNQMREILKIVTTKKGKDALYEILKGMKSLRPLMSELQGSQ